MRLALVISLLVIGCQTAPKHATASRVAFCTEEYEETRYESETDLSEAEYVHVCLKEWAP